VIETQHLSNHVSPYGDATDVRHILSPVDTKTK
jgi:hypothetical protein